MPKPNITPIEALALFKDDPEGERFTDDGNHKITLAASYMGPSSILAPQAEEPDGTTWFCTGEPNDPITSETDWVQWTL